MNIIVATLVCQALLAQAAPLQGLKKHSFFLQNDGDTGKPKAKGLADALPSWGENTTHHSSSRLMCGITEQVGAHTDKYEDCPANCAYFAQNRKDTQHCTFLCVPGAECGRWNPNKPIPDSIKNTKTCRGPKVAFCNTPKLDGSDTCDICQRGFALHHDDGMCYFQHWTGIIIGFAIVAVVLVIVISWVVDLCCREAVNQEAVEKASAWRSRSKIIDREGGGLSTHPVTTNLCNKNVAGPGMLLHFRFQAFFIVWPLCCALVWTILACFHNELFILGTRKFGTPRHNCILVAWGYETQQRLMWTKVLFLAIVYVGSFVSFLLFSVTQHRKYQRMDASEKTMKDFCLELKGLPKLPGSSKDVEKDIQKAVEAATGKTLIGVTVAWNYNEQQEDIDRACNKDLTWREVQWNMEQQGKKPTRQEVDKALKEEAQRIESDDPTGSMGPLKKWMYNTEKEWMGPDDDEEQDVKALIESLESSESAFVVFNTSEDRDEVLQDAVNGKTIDFDATKYGTDFGKSTLTLEDVNNEPANINWHNFGDDDPSALLFRFMKGIAKVYIPALLIWFFGFYVPYAYSLYNFNYDNGAELPGYYSLIFTIVVCGGNATMYVVCDICCDMMGFRYKDTKQVTYMLMYLVACMINVFLDMIVTYFTAYKVMVGLDFRTYHGERLAEIDAFTDQFETYAMQRSLGGNTYAYAWPSTFFLCFVLEPFVTIMIPYHIGKVVVRTHREIRGTTAEAYLMAFEFDLGRYADILLNVFLGILIFYFPGGYIWSLFYAMCFSHCFIYCFDHWRVLSVIPYVKIVSTQVDWWAQVMMCACCGVILSCLVFKANCETYSGYCMKDMSLILYTSLAGILHFIVHLLLLIYLVPKLGVEAPDDNVGMTFEAAAKDEARTWFSSNPVHCLRSQFVQGNTPHCRLAAWGKEHLLEENANIGCYFKGEAAEVESYEVRKSFTALATSFSGKSVDK